MKSFSLEKTWRSSGVGSTTFNAPGNFQVPFGKSIVNITGRGGTGNSPVPGNAAYNPPSGGNYAGVNYTAYYTKYADNTIIESSTSYGSSPNCPSTSASYTNSAYTPGNYLGVNWNQQYIWGGYLMSGTNYNCPVPYNTGFPDFQTIQYTCTPYYNPGTYTPSYYTATNYSCTPFYNPTVPGNLYYNPSTPGNAGAATNVLGVTFPGGAVGSVAPVVPATPIDAQYTYTYPNSYSVTVPSGGYITIEVL